MELPSCIAIVLHSIWFMRNQVIFPNKHPAPLHLISLINNWMKDYIIKGHGNSNSTCAKTVSPTNAFTNVHSQVHRFMRTVLIRLLFKLKKSEPEAHG